jgi:hypothetical protein
MSSENETIRHDETTPSDDERVETIERAVGDLVGIGRLWAAHGLSVGRSALETSATTLRITADILGDLSERFRTDERADEHEEPVEDAA